VGKIAPDGTISTFAGNGIAGESGDGGTATQARIIGAVSLAMDAAGTFYIADNGGTTVRVITTDGIIHTIASRLPVDNVSNAGIGGDGGPAMGADYNQIAYFVLDPSGNIYSSMLTTSASAC
jgi:hypothetical protein